MNLFFGLDPSLTLTGVACYAESGGEYSRFCKLDLSPDDYTGLRRLFDVVTRLDRWIYKATPFEELDRRFFGVEGISFGSSGMSNTVIDLSVLQGMILGILLATGYTRGIVIVPPALLKKFATGSGHASKAGVKHEVLRNHWWPDEDISYDVADAVALAKFSEMFFTDDVFRKEMEPKVMYV